MSCLIDSYSIGPLKPRLLDHTKNLEIALWCKTCCEMLGPCAMDSEPVLRETELLQASCRSEIKISVCSSFQSQNSPCISFPERKHCAELEAIFLSQNPFKLCYYILLFSWHYLKPLLYFTLSVLTYVFFLIVLHRIILKVVLYGGIGILIIVSAVLYCGT